MNGRLSLNLPVDMKLEAERQAKKQEISLTKLIIWALADKIAELKNNLDDQNFPLITYKLGTNNQLIPIIRGKGIRVQTIVIAHHVWHQSVAEIAADYDLSKKEIQESLGFYSAHKQLIDALIAENEALAQEHA
jgi:uncharacterized protein (DUF433 family)